MEELLISEFIEMTGFEPTSSEYQEIEKEYMELDIDKREFCKQWLKHYGVQRLTRKRALRIEELERTVLHKDREIQVLREKLIEHKKRDEKIRKVMGL